MLCCIQVCNVTLILQLKVVSFRLTNIHNFWFHWGPIQDIEVWDSFTKQNLGSNYILAHHWSWEQHRPGPSPQVASWESRRFAEIFYHRSTCCLSRLPLLPMASIPQLLWVSGTNSSQTLFSPENCPQRIELPHLQISESLLTPLLALKIKLSPILPAKMGLFGNSRNCNLRQATRAKP